MKPHPTRNAYSALRRDLFTQIATLRNAAPARQGYVTLRCIERSEITSALENAIRLIDALPEES